MKQPKKPTYEQKKKLANKGFNPSDYRFVDELDGAWRFIHKETKEIIWIEK